MRIALVVPGGVDRSGRERVIPALLWLIERLARRHDVTVFALGQNELPAEWDLLGAHVVDLGRPRRFSLPGLGIVARMLQLRRAAGRAVATGHVPADVAQTLPSVPPREFDVVHAFWASPCGFLAVNAFGRTPVVISLAGGELAAIPAIGYGCGLHRRERAKVRHALRKAAAVTAASEPMISAAAQIGIRARLVPLGVEASRFIPRSEEHGGFRLLHVASLNRVKDQPTLLRAFALARPRVPQLTLEIIGEDTLGGEIQSLAQSLGISDAVQFRGWLPSEDVGAAFGSADLLVVSSLHEAGPVAYVEAAACGVPTVGTAVGHIAEGSPERCLAVRIGDSAALAEAIVELATDEPRRRRIAEAALAWARENDADATARRFEAVYEEVVRRSGPVILSRRSRGEERASS